MLVEARESTVFLGVTGTLTRDLHRPHGYILAEEIMPMSRRRVRLSLTMLILLLAPWTGAGEVHTPQPPETFTAEVPVAWFDLLYDVVKTEQFSPPQASWVYGIAAVALYEALVAGSLDHQSLVGQLNDLTAVPRPKPARRYPWPTVANSALARSIEGLLPVASPASLDAITSLERMFATQFQASLRPRVYARSVPCGQIMANAVLAWAATDGYAMLNSCPYTPPVGPGLWEPTPPAFVPNPLQPCWGQLRPMGCCAPATSAPRRPRRPTPRSRTRHTRPTPSGYTKPPSP